MGQKINPINFRSNSLDQLQDNKWTVKISNNKYSHLLHQDFEIQRFIKDFLYIKKIFIHKTLIHRFSNDITIKIYCFYINNPNINKKKIQKYLNYLIFNLLNLNKNYTLNIQILNLNKNKKFLKKKQYRVINKKKFKYKRIPNINNIFYLFMTCFTFKSSEILTTYICDILQKSTKKKQFQQINFIKNLLKDFFFFYKKSLIGLKICIKGRLNGSQRSKKIIFSFGQTPLQTLNINVNYSFNNFVTKDGLYGVKVWFFYKKK